MGTCFTKSLYILGKRLLTLAASETDFVPVDTLTVSNLFVAIGQRYDILIDASQAVDNYWFNVTMFPNSACGSSFNSAPAAIFSYEGAPAGLPTDVGVAPINANCQDTVLFTPVVSRTADATTLVVDAADPSHQIDIGADFTAPLVWSINTSSATVQWDKPVFEYVLEGNTSYPRSENLILLVNIHPQGKRGSCKTNLVF